jgi:hypothetical protein
VADITLYDRSIQQYLLNHNEFVYYAPTDKAKEKNSKSNGDTTKYPFISFYRDPDISIDESRANNANIVRGDLTKRAYKTSPSDELFSYDYVHSIPVNLMYQVDIWAARQSEVLELAQSVLIDLRSARRVLHVPMNPEGELGRFSFDDISLVDW